MDTDRRIAGLAGTQGGLVARRQLAALGVGRGAIERRLAARRLHPVPGHRGVFAVGHTARGRRTALWAAHLALGPSSVISHRSAAALWELRRTAAARVELTVTGPSKRRSAIQVHRTTSLPARHVTTVDGLPTTTVPRTLVDLAALLPERSVETAVDRADALRLLDMADLLQTLRENPRRPGARRMRIVIGRQRIGMTLTDTDLEEMVLALVRAAGLPDPVTQHPILTYRADLCWPEARLVVEADGDRWHRTRGARQHDRRRDVALANAGWTVLRFTDADIVLDPGYVVAAIRTALARLAPT